MFLDIGLAVGICFLIQNVMSLGGISCEVWAGQIF